jgi:hypothetical protein
MEVAKVLIFTDVVVRPLYSFDCPPIGVAPAREVPAYLVLHNNNTGAAKARRESKRRKHK